MLNALISEMPEYCWTRFFRAHPWLICFVTSILVFIIIFDWNWLRRPLESYVSNKTQRTFSISDLDVKPGFGPTINSRFPCAICLREKYSFRASH